MKLVAVIASKVIRLLPVAVEGGKIVNWAALARAFEARFGFLQGPRTVEEYQLGNGVVFQRGMFDGQYVIDRFTIYNDGLVCDLAADSAVADAFIDNVLAWASNEFALVPPGPEGVRRAYLSTIDVELSVDTSKTIPGFDDLCRRITHAIRSYGISAPDFKPTMLGFSGDNTTLPDKAGPQMGFSVERRGGEPYSAGRYFSKAPLATADHLELLGDFERKLLSRTSA